MVNCRELADKNASCGELRGAISAPGSQWSYMCWWPSGPCVVSYDLQATSWTFLPPPRGGSSELCPIGNGLFQLFIDRQWEVRVGQDTPPNPLLSRYATAQRGCSDMVDKSEWGTGARRVGGIPIVQKTPCSTNLP